jgi:ethanolaminephosphotransferase
MLPHFLIMAFSFSSFDFDIPGWAMLIFGFCILTY